MAALGKASKELISCLDFGVGEAIPSPRSSQEFMKHSIMAQSALQRLIIRKHLLYRGLHVASAFAPDCALIL